MRLDIIASKDRDTVLQIAQIAETCLSICPDAVGPQKIYDLYVRMKQQAVISSLAAQQCTVKGPACKWLLEDLEGKPVQVSDDAIASDLLGVEPAILPQPTNPLDRTLSAGPWVLDQQVYEMKGCESSYSTLDTDARVALDTMARDWLERHHRPPSRIEAIEEACKFDPNNYTTSAPSLHKHMTLLATHALTTNFEAHIYEQSRSACCFTPTPQELKQHIAIDCDKDIGPKVLQDLQSSHRDT